MLPLKIYKVILVMSERETKKNTKWAKSCEEILTLNEALSFQRHCMHSSFVHYAHTSLRCPSSSHHIFLPHASSLLHLSLFSIAQFFFLLFLQPISASHRALYPWRGNLLASSSSSSSSSWLLVSVSHTLLTCKDGARVCSWDL